MTRVNTKRFEKKIKEITDEFQNTSTLKKTAEYAADRIRKRTKLGKGVKENFGNSAPLKKLTPKYRKKRTKAKKNNELDSTTSPAKSNLTFTGQMLDAFKITVSKGKALIGIKDSSRKDSDSSNREIAEYVSVTRPFLNLSRAEINGVVRFIKDIIKKRT